MGTVSRVICLCLLTILVIAVAAFCIAPLVYADGRIRPLIAVLFGASAAVILSLVRHGDRQDIAAFNEAAAGLNSIGSYPLPREVFALLRPSLQAVATMVGWVPWLRNKWIWLCWLARIAAACVLAAGVVLLARRGLAGEGLDWGVWPQIGVLFIAVLVALVCRAKLPKPVIASEKEFADLICTLLQRASEPSLGAKTWLVSLVDQGVDLGGELIKKKVAELAGAPGP